MRIRTMVALGAAAVALTACAPMTDIVGADAAVASPGPVCGYERFGSYVNVFGTPGGRITVNGHRKGRLVRVDADTADESGPWSGLRDNVRLTRRHPYIAVAVNGRRCYEV